MTTGKIAVSLPRDLLDDVRRLVRAGHASSVSAYVAAALEDKVRNDDLRTLLDEMLERTGGPLSDEERAAVDAELDP